MKDLRRVQDVASHRHFSLLQGTCELDMGIVAYHQSATRLQAWRCCPTFFKEKNCAYCVLLKSLIIQPAGVDRSLVPTQIADPYNAKRGPSTCVASYGACALKPFIRQPAVSQPLAADGLVFHGPPRQRHVGPPPTAIEDIENCIHHGTICARLPVPAAEPRVDIRRHRQV